MSYALEMECPYCGKLAKQHVSPKKPYRLKWHWTYTPPEDSWRSIDYCVSRAHLRYCQSCRQDFVTQELVSDYLANLHGAFNDLKKKMEKLEAEVTNFKATNTRLQEAVYQLVEEMEKRTSEVAALRAKNSRLQEAVDQAGKLVSSAGKLLAPVATPKRTSRAPQQLRITAA